MFNSPLKLYMVYSDSQKYFDRRQTFFFSKFLNPTMLTSFCLGYANQSFYGEYIEKLVVRSTGHVGNLPLTNESVQT